MTTAAVVLAAGRGTRFDPAGGAHKLLAPVGGDTVVRLAVRAALAAPVDEVVVVTGDRTAAIAEALHGLAVRLVENPEFRAGMATSLRLGVAAVRGSAQAALIALGDQPTVPVDAYRRVVAAWRRDRRPIVVPSYEGTPGHPVLFAAELFDELAALAGDVGARGVIAADPARVATVDLPFAPPRDIDTYADLAAVIAERA